MPTSFDTFGGIKDKWDPVSVLKVFTLESSGKHRPVDKWFYYNIISMLM